MHGLLALLVLMSSPAQPAPAQPGIAPAPAESGDASETVNLQALVGQWIRLTGWDGRVLLARLLEVDPDSLRIQLPKNTKAWVPRAVVAEIEPAAAPGAGRRRGSARWAPGLDWGPPTSLAPPAAARSLRRLGGARGGECRSTAACMCRPREKGYVERRSFWVEWVGLRTHVGYLVGWSLMGDGGTPTASLELTLFGLHWRHFYWEILRGGGGYGLLGYWGTALGVPVRLAPNGRHELRIGVHLTMLLGYYPGPSGAYVAYHYRVQKRFSLHIGVMQYSYPTGVGIVMGLSM